AYRSAAIAVWDYTNDAERRSYAEVAATCEAAYARLLSLIGTAGETRGGYTPERTAEIVEAMDWLDTHPDVRPERRVTDGGSQWIIYGTPKMIRHRRLVEAVKLARATLTAGSRGDTP
ncbi:MAG: hypothetical protein C0497_14845, partial [Gemmatimonas sp.]|nr:hypothetical protein [Gemmatimonas sp.]